MPLAIKKDFEELMRIALKRLSEQKLTDGSTITTKPGGIARLLLAVVNSCFTDFYELLQVNHLMSFLSTSNDEGLDLIGALVSCTRYENEDKESYRYRISKQVTALEAGNELSVRLAVLSCSGVQDVKMKPFTYGTGSFSVFIVTEQIVGVESILAEAREKVDKVVSYGNKFTISLPEFIPVEMRIKLVFLKDAQNVETIKALAKNKLKEYINSRGINKSIIVNEIIETIMATSDDIYDMEITHFGIDDKPVLSVNQDCRWNERFIESPNPDSIMVA